MGKGGPRFFFEEKKPKPSRQFDGKEDDKTTTEEVVEESITEDDPGMSEDDPQEIETGQKMWLSEKVTTLEKENAELKKGAPGDGDEALHPREHCKASG